MTIRLYRRVFVFFCAISMMLSCAKETSDIDDINYPLVVTAKSLESQGAIRLFTKDGEVTDPATIARFTINTNIFELSFERNERNKITFLSKDSLTFSDIPLKYGVTEPQNGKFIMSRDFIAQEQVSFQSYFYTTEDLWRLGAHRDPLEKITLFGTVTFRGKETRVGYGSFQSFKFPILLFKLKRESGAGETKYIRENSGNFFDEFDMEFIHTLKNQDTLAIQQNYVRFGR